MKLICALMTLVFLTSVLAEDKPAPRDDSAGARKREDARLDELVLEIELLKEDLAVQARLSGPGGHPSFTVELAIVQRALQIQEAIAKARQEPAFRWPETRARFVTEVEGPFVLLRERILQDCKLAKARGLLAELKSEEKSLDDVVLEIAFLEDDLETHDTRLTLTKNGHFMETGSLENALIQRVLRLQALIARVKRERMFRAPRQRAKFISLIEGPFIRLRERVRRKCDRPRFRGVLAARETLDLMLDEFAAEHFENVVALGNALPDPGPDEQKAHHLQELREQMKTLVAVAAERRCDVEPRPK